MGSRHEVSKSVIWAYKHHVAALIAGQVTLAAQWLDTANKLAAELNATN